MYLNSFGCWLNLTSLFAISIAPSPPLAQPSTTLNSIFLLANFSLIYSISFSVSDAYLFNATITFKPNLFFILSICLYKLSIPFSRFLLYFLLVFFFFLLHHDI